MDFLSAAWMEHYKTLWNQDLDLVQGLKGFTALIEYGWEGESRPSAYLHVQDGRATATHYAVPPATPDFVMKASTENWGRLCDGSLSGRAALLTKKLKFQGSMITAMKYMNPFNKSIELIGKV